MPRSQRPDRSALPSRELARLVALKHEFADLEICVRGSLVHVRTRCGKPACACATDPDARHGPYVRWTRKVAGRTVSTPIRPDEVPLFEKWLENSRRLDDLVDRLHELGLRAATDVVKARAKAGR